MTFSSSHPMMKDSWTRSEFELPTLDSEETALISGASSQNTILVSAFLALIVLLLAGYFLKKKHEKPPETTALFPEGSENHTYCSLRIP